MGLTQLKTHRSGRLLGTVGTGGWGMHISRSSKLALLLVCLLAAATAWASISGRISGIVTDPKGSVVPGASVTTVNTATGVRSTLKTDGAGFYNFASLSVGTYDVEIVQKGFKTYQQAGIVLD